MREQSRNNMLAFRQHPVKKTVPLTAPLSADIPSHFPTLLQLIAFLVLILAELYSHRSVYFEPCYDEAKRCQLSLEATYQLGEVIKLKIP